MPWNISSTGGSITLPIDPADAKNQLLRQPRILQMQSTFPFPIDVGPQVYNTIVTGLIWPKTLAMQLNEMCKAATQQIVQITEDTAQYNGLYAVDRATIERVGPEYSPAAILAGNDGQVYHYEIWFVQFADQSTIQPGDQGSLSGTEPGIGTTDFSNFLGQVQKDIFQFFTGITA